MNNKEMERRTEQLNNLVDLQTANGTWDWNPYMLGMANGLLLARGLIRGDAELKLLDPPATWKGKTSTDNTILTAYFRLMNPTNREEFELKNEFGPRIRIEEIDHVPTGPDPVG